MRSNRCLDLSLLFIQGAGWRRGSICWSMLNVSDHGCRAITWVQVILLNAKIASNGEESSGGTIIADGGDTVGGRDGFVRHSLSAYIPRASLTIWKHCQHISNPARMGQSSTYPSVYWTIRPFFDQANQQGPGSLCSFWFSTRITQGASLCGAFGTLQTLRSPSDVWDANISDFCLEDDPCQASPAIGEGALGVVRVWRMVKDGWRVAIRMEPFR